jgi:NAD(P)-dependent dehydrogenase (short-subunit alcohol dehydrogenase family)
MDNYVLITGASSGIGRSIATTLSELGYNCVITGRNPERLDKSLCNLKGKGHMIFTGNLNDDNFITKLACDVPMLSGIVHAAGIIKLLPWKFVNKKDFTDIMETNCFAPFFLTQSLLKFKKVSEGGSIVFISSISGPIVGSKGNLMYSASKSAVNGMVKTLALELSGKKIRVNAINAGMVLTEMWSDENNPLSNEQLIKDKERYPLGYGIPEDVSGLTSFLLSDNAKWITGATMVADGGFSIQ